jgi:excisionase family DNA binding protein/PAS domain S-box-containing protein
VNLKQAAARLGVHYQTAYRWVRSGDLSAVRVGARYEISDAAIHQFIATRQSILRQAVPSVTPAPAATADPDELLLDLEAMAGDPLISVPALAAYTARRGREVLGDLCLVAITRPDGRIDRAAIDHAQPDRAAFLASALSVTGAALPLPDGLLAPVFERGTAVRIPHVPQDRLRAGIRPELRQYLADQPIMGLLAVPVFADGIVRGMVAFSRDTPANPYTEADEAFASEFADRIGTLVIAAHEIAAAWIARERLARRFHDWLAGQPQDAVFGPEVVAALLEDDGFETSVVVFDADARIIGATKAVERTSGYRADVLVGRTFTDLVEPAQVAGERENFARLATGELDYHDLHAERRRSDGSQLDFAMHRVAVRRLDSSLACVISVGRPVRVTNRVKDLIGGE